MEEMEKKLEEEKLNEQKEELEKKVEVPSEAERNSALKKVTDAIDKITDYAVGEDGKFDLNDVQRIGGDLKDNITEGAENVGKFVVGDDGKFDKEDLDRMSLDARKAATSFLNSSEQKLEEIKRKINAEMEEAKETQKVDD